MISNAYKERKKQHKTKTEKLPVAELQFKREARLVSVWFKPVPCVQPGLIFFIKRFVGDGFILRFLCVFFFFFKIESNF